MDINRKRVARPPLRETSGNVPSPNKKKLKLSAKESVSLDVHTPQLTHPQPAGSLHHQPEHSDTLAPAALQSSSNGGSVRSALLARSVLKVDSYKAKSNRLMGDELSEWRSNWRKIMKSSVVYFDTQGFESSNHVSEQKRAHKGLKYVGSLVVPFYDKDVTIIVSRRPYNPAVSYPSNDIFHDASSLKIKVWNFDKVFRFLSNLGVNDSEYMSSANYENGDLVNLLKEEKIFGSTDKDPTAKREDLHYLDNNYIYVYDLSQSVRPIVVREWNAENKYPRFFLTLDGKCPFIQDTENSDRKKVRRAKKYEETSHYRQLLKIMAYELVQKPQDRRISTSSLLTSTAIEEDTNSHPNHQQNSNNDSTISQGSNPEDNEASVETEPEDLACKFKHPKPNLMRNSSCLPTNNSNSNSNSRFYDVAASGFNGTSNAVQMSIDSGTFPGGGNGLGPTMSQVPSKNINNLKRRIFMKKQKQSMVEKDENKDLKPGYCENCRIKYDHFDDHINSSRHRRFAMDDGNFKDIDNLISTLNENKVFGFITSDGDFSYTE